MADPDDPCLRKPIIIIGAPRSGTTMLHRIFNEHPHLGLLWEPRLTWRYRNDKKSDMLRPQDARPDVIRHIRTTFADSVQGNGKVRMVEKTPSNSLRMGFVDRVFPDAKFIHTVRHGLDSVLSIRDFWLNRSHGIPPAKLLDRLREIKLRQATYYAKEAIMRLMPKRLSGPNLWGPRIPGIEQMCKDLDVIEICCLQWRMCVELSCHYGRALPPDRYMEYRLEDMSFDTLDRIIDFCELDHCDSMRTFFRQNFDPTKASNRVHAGDPKLMSKIIPWIEPTLLWLGYETDFVAPRADPSGRAEPNQM